MSLSVELFLDGYEAGRSISADIETLYSCCQPMDNSIQAKKPSPPWVVFALGQQHAAYGDRKERGRQVDIVRQRRHAVAGHVHGDDGGGRPRLVAQNPTSGSPNSMRSHLLIEGDSLPSVAYKEYGNAAWWRPLAEANGIDDPFKLVIGSRLLVPDWTMRSTRESESRRSTISPSRCQQGSSSYR